MSARKNKSLKENTQKSKSISGNIQKDVKDKVSNEKPLENTQTSGKQSVFRGTENKQNPRVLSVPAHQRFSSESKSISGNVKKPEGVFNTNWNRSSSGAENPRFSTVSETPRISSHIRKSDVKELKLNDGVIVVGLPGVGNVGKIAIDFIADDLKLKARGHMFFPFFPNLVFVRRDGFVEVPHMKVYGDEKKNVGFFSSPFQPAEEVKSFEFSLNLVNVAKKLGAKTIITTGGFAKERVNSKPKSYFICSNKKSYEGWGKKLEGLGVDEKVSGKIGTIIGASGLVLGLAPRHGLDSFSILVETGVEQIEVDFRSARALVEILDKLLSLGVNLKEFDKKMKERVKMMKKEKVIDPELAKLIQREAGMGANDEEEANYLG